MAMRSGGGSDAIRSRTFVAETMSFVDGAACLARVTTRDVRTAIQSRAFALRKTPTKAAPRWQAIQTNLRGPSTTCAQKTADRKSPAIAGSHDCGNSFCQNGVPRV